MTETKPVADSPAKAHHWINDQESDSEQEVGLVPHNRGYKLKRWATSDEQHSGNKLRATKSITEEAELIKDGKKHTVVKRKRRSVDEASDEEDPYTDINIEEILSPIETPTDIIQRPSLRRILKSRQIDALAGTAMEFIEGEKNFNKILCRLSSILHEDDPQYLDLHLNDHPNQDTNGTDEEKKEDPAELLRTVKDLLLENINYSNEYLSKLQGARDRLTKARLQKDALYLELRQQAAEQRRYHHKQ
ncbi:hypothetical protein DM01DRAFT_1335270 [Hesseltinella vesiculosa]|uniref:Transcriptional regulatory protein RXT2 N-terminal domain-containing protein n=1 Tax=Hesseltinella vesiculosa TaxID=101127 RepID=A0A1X2GIZ5_9FUNG|nr:hypothetical protein DM01DRAFT_1335270 [Hesseltinella vesiculosa]